MSTQHTPGPWNLAFGKEDAVIYTDGTIAEVNNTMSDWKANARLIAAAPELLAALQSLVQCLPEDMDSYEDASAYRQIKSAIERSEEVIAKATQLP